MISNGRRAEGKRYRYDFRKRYRLYTDTQAERLSLPHLTIRDMRRSFASVLVSSRKRSVYEVVQWLGDDIDVVQKHYGHLVPHDGAISLAFD